MNAKFWTEGVPVEDAARQQIANTADLPILAGHIAVMPDVHWGMGSTVGTVIPTIGAVIPAAVGVDIGCGMCAVRTNLFSGDLPDSLAALRSEIEARIPVGFNQRKGATNFSQELADRFDELRIHERIKFRSDIRTKVVEQAGTLGGGNHFVEICLDETNSVWIMLHSGSRGIGNMIGQAAITMAKEEAAKRDIALVDQNLAWLEEGTPQFAEYIEAMMWAQDYAAYNRRMMLDAVLDAMHISLQRDIVFTMTAINCHHNYTNKEVHFGREVWLTRKGAVSAQKDEYGIIPGSMGTKSYIVKGRGHQEAYCSCSHGAGRRMSRKAAGKTFNHADVMEQTYGVECRKDDGIIDELPGAYKDIDAVMAAQTELVEIVHTLKQILCVKG